LRRFAGGLSLGVTGGDPRQQTLSDGSTLAIALRVMLARGRKARQGGHRRDDIAQTSTLLRPEPNGIAGESACKKVPHNAGETLR
jgi:hypothetical protein